MSKLIALATLTMLLPGCSAGEDTDPGVEACEEVVSAEDFSDDRLQVLRDQFKDSERSSLRNAGERWTTSVLDSEIQISQDVKMLTLAKACEEAGVEIPE